MRIPTEVLKEFQESLEKYGQDLERSWLANESLWKDPTGPDPLHFKVKENE